MDAHSYALAVVAMVTAAVAAFFYLRLAVTMYSPVGAEGGPVGRRRRCRRRPDGGDGRRSQDASGRLPEPASLAVLTDDPPPTTVEERVVRVPGTTWVAIGLCVGFTVVFGIFPAPVIDFAHQATLLFT